MSATRMARSSIISHHLFSSHTPVLSSSSLPHFQTFENNIASEAAAILFEHCDVKLGMLHRPLNTRLLVLLTEALSAI